jgi:predicted metal-binding membrane protein
VLGAAVVGRVTTSVGARPLADRLPYAAPALAGAAAAWVGVVVVARNMGSMPGSMGLGLVSFLAVWTLMMAAMMLPSVTPFATLHAHRIHDHRGIRLTALTGGYLLVWAAVGVPAYAAADLAGSIVDDHARLATATAVTIFAICGLYQLTPVKDRCLARCRSPLGSLFHYASFRGRTRDLRVGIHHGAYCFSCCWALMLLLVAFGVMNVPIMVGLAAVVLIEKRIPRGRTFSVAVGVVALGLAVAAIWNPGLAPGLHGSNAMTGM